MSVDLLEGIATARAIRRYRDEPIPDHDLRDILFAASRAPSGSNRQPFRFVVLRDSPTARRAKALLADGARNMWSNKRVADGYERGSGADPASPKARMARTMQHYTDHFATVPAVVLPCYLPYRAPSTMDGASIYPAVQNLLLAARALGYGGAISGFHYHREAELRELLHIPPHAQIAATISLGRPAGRHGPVRRRPLAQTVYEDTWESSPAWAVDPPGTAFTQAGPPKAVAP